MTTEKNWPIKFNIHKLPVISTSPAKSVYLSRLSKVPLLHFVADDDPPIQYIFLY